MKISPCVKATGDVGLQFTTTEGKIARLTEWLNGGNKTYSEIHFYTD